MSVILQEVNFLKNWYDKDDLKTGIKFSVIIPTNSKKLKQNISKTKMKLYQMNTMAVDSETDKEIGKR